MRGLDLLIGAQTAPAPAVKGADTVVDWGLWQTLLAAMGVVLAVLAILIGIISILVVVWGRDWIVSLVRREAQREAEQQHIELRGRLVGYVGFIFGRLSTDRPDLLHSAIQYTKMAYDELPTTTGWKVTAMNNLAFYYSRRRYATDAPAAVALARQLLNEYAKNPDVEYLTTYASVVSAFSGYFDRPRQTLLEAERMMEEIDGRPDATTPQKQSAARHLETIRAALRALGGGGAA